MAKTQKKNAGMNILRADIPGTAVKSLGCFGIKQVGAVGGLAINEVVAKKAPKMAKFSGPAMLAIGVAGAVLLENEYARSVTDGIGTAGSIITAKDHLPENVKSKVGLQGLGATTIDATPNWEELANTQSIDDAEFEEMIAGLSSSESVESDDDEDSVLNVAEMLYAQ